MRSFCSWVGRGWAVVVLAAVALAGCGGSGGGSSGGGSAGAAVVRHAVEVAFPGPGGVVGVSGPVLARVGGFVVTSAALAGKMAVVAHNGGSETDALPVPPLFVSCIAALRAHAARGVTVAGLKADCAKTYEEVRDTTFRILIEDYWEIGVARELGVGVSVGEARRTLEASFARDAHTAGQLHSYLRTYAESLPDLLFSVQASLSWDRVREKIKASIPPVTPAQVAAYYAGHAAALEVRETRNLWLLHTKKSLAAAQRMRRELVSGTSFAALAKRYAAEQPPYTREGFLPELQDRAFAEPSLNDAIFAAKPGVISGPVAVKLEPGFDHRSNSDILNVDGYYLFEVKNIVRPAHKPSLAEAKASLTKELPQALYSKAFAAFDAGFESHWRAMTDCLTGLIIAECRQSPAHTG
jgi:PPIC-type PPIASE domain